MAARYLQANQMPVRLELLANQKEMMRWCFHRQGNWLQRYRYTFRMVTISDGVYISVWRHGAYFCTDFVHSLASKLLHFLMTNKYFWKALFVQSIVVFFYFHLCSFVTHLNADWLPCTCSRFIWQFVARYLKSFTCAANCKVFNMAALWGMCIELVCYSTQQMRMMLSIPVTSQGWLTCKIVCSYYVFSHTQYQN